MRHLLYRLLGLLLALAAPALQAYDVGPKTSLFFRAADDVRALAAPAGSLTKEDALDRLADFRQVAEFGPLPGGQEFWIHARLRSQLPDDIELRAELLQWAEVDTWARQPGGQWKPLASSGIYSGRHSRLVELDPTRTPIDEAPSQFPVFLLKSGAQIELLFHARDNFIPSPSILTPRYSDHAGHLELRRFGLVLEGLMLGILLAAAAFGSYSALTNRDRTSLLYAIWIIFALLSAASLWVHDGSRMFEFLIDIEDVRLNHNTMAMFLNNTISYGQAIGYVLFARSFLDLKTHMPLAYRFSNFYILASVAHWGFRVFIPHTLTGMQVWGLYSVMLMLMLGTLLVCAWQRYRLGLQVAKFFMVALVPYLFFRGVFILGLFLPMPSPFSFMAPVGLGLFLQNSYTAQAFGICCEALIMGLAVFSKNRWLQEELQQKIQAQSELVEQQNQRLEATVAERTRELLQSKADTERQHQLVVDSIRYASRLQKALLPRGQRLQHAVNSWHALWEPRDTIGGDVWWVSAPDAEGRVTVVVADSTGHGVPGAMLSVLITTSLERMFATRPELDPSAALLALDEALRIGLNQSGAEAESDDGCDAGILRIDPARRRAEFAGAKLGLLHLKGDGRVERLQATRISLGYRQLPERDPEVATLAYQPGDTLMMVTDGITDQIGDQGAPRAYGFRRLVALLERQAGASAGVIAEALRSDLLQWQGSQIRRDDATAVVLQLA